jgi:DNA adenine methylase
MPTTFFCRIGSKKPLRKTIISKSPKDFTTYVEPFVGSGAIYFELNIPDKKSVLNDKDSELMSGYRMLKNGVSGNAEKFDDLTLEQIQSFVNKSPTNSMDKLAKFSYMSCNTFGAKGVGKIYKASNLYLKLKKLPEYKEYMKNTTLLSQDYKTVIKKYDSPGTYFYLDPPYEKSDSQKIYKEKGFNIEELRNTLKGIKGKFLLSMNDSAEVRELFKGYKISGLTVMGQGKKDIGQGSRKEVLIKNY